MSNQPSSDPSEKNLAERFAKLSPEKRKLLQQKLASSLMKGVDLVAKSLRDCGLTHLYGVAGLPTQELLPACKRQGIRPLGVYHQTSAVCMALAQNYQAGRLVAAALTSAGPAATNTITGLLVAKDNGWPVLVLGGRRASFQKFNAMPLVEPVTKHAIEVRSPDTICQSVREACGIAVSGRPGPVYIQLHEDALMGYGRVTSTPWIGPSPGEAGPTGTTIENIVDAALPARRPALLLGEGVRWSVEVEKLRTFIETLNLPFITSPMGRGFIPEDHPLCFNQARTALQAETDFALVLGSPLNWVFRHGSELSRTARVIRLDFEPDEKSEVAGAREYVQCDPGEVVTQLLEAVQNRQKEANNPVRRKHLIDWQDRLRRDSGRSRRRLDAKMSCNDTNPMSAYRMMKEIRDALPRDCICITEGNISMMVAQQVIPAYHPGSRMDAGLNACMGVGIPFGIGAKLASPDRPVVVIAGDYGFSLSAMELETCVRYNIPVVIIVANNQGNNGAIKQAEFFPEENSELITMFRPELEYDRIMELFGGRGSTVRDPEQLKSRIERAIAEGLPACINVVMDPFTPIPNAWGEQDSRIQEYE